MKKTIILVALLAIGGSASAQVLYSQAPHTPGAAGGNGLSGFLGVLPPGTAMFDRQLADDFTVPAIGWNVTSVSSSWAQFDPADTNVVTGVNIVFWNKSGGTVGSVFATATPTGAGTVVSTGPGTYFGRPERIIDTEIVQLTLVGGDYYVQIQPIVDHNWFNLTSSPTTPIAGTPAHFRKGPLSDPANDPAWPTVWTATDPGDGVFNAANDITFTLVGSPVPEPGSMIALGIGAAALLARRRRRKLA